MGIKFDLSVLFEFAGDIKDGSKASEKLRVKLQQEATAEDVEQLLQESLDGNTSNHNRALQDIVNNIGQRLGFTVDYGMYNPGNSANGYDGLWKTTNFADETVHLVVETKKSTNFTINHNEQPGKYMDRLVKEHDVDEGQVYGLIVVGEDDSIDSVVDAVRGSTYRNRIRVITCSRLMELLLMAEENNLEYEQVAQVLLPMDTVNIGSIVGLIHELVESNGVKVQEETSENNIKGAGEDGDIFDELDKKAGVVYDEGDISFEDRESFSSEAERLRKVVGLLIDYGFICKDELPYSINSGKRHLLNDEPVHPHKDMRRCQEIRDGFYMENHFSTKSIHSKIEGMVREKLEPNI